MTFATITYDVPEGVARLTLDRPEAGNAIDVDMAREFMQATMAVSEDAAIRVVVLTGAGDNFCVGGDLRRFSSHADLGLHLKEITTYLHAAVSRLARLDAPVIAAVQGSAAGAGMSLACGADLLLVAPSARFVVAYSRVGFSPDGGDRGTCHAWSVCGALSIWR